jgi:hypothetical protein
MTKATISTDVQVPAPATKPAAKAAAAPQASQPRPDTIVISEMTHVAFAVAAQLIRVGYIHSPFTMPEVFQSTGQATLTMIRGNVDAHAVSLAEAAEAHAVALQQVAFEREVEAAAKQMVEAQQREAKQAAIAAEIAAQRASLQKLEQAAQAA